MPDSRERVTTTRFVLRNRRLIPGFYRVQEQSSVPVPTPQYVARPICRRRTLATYQMLDSQMVTMGITITDKRGNPAPMPPGTLPPVWMVDSPAVLALSPAADGLTCLVSALGPLGDAVVSVAVSDASGNPLASGGIDVSIVAGAPRTVIITPGTPSEQP